VAANAGSLQVLRRSPTIGFSDAGWPAPWCDRAGLIH
jgi:hypothetical protein